MYTCSVITLVQSRKSFLASLMNRGARVWKEVATPPVTGTTCVSIHGRMLAIGGKDSGKKPTTAIHMYNPTTDSWEVISHMGSPRYACITAVFPNYDELMIVGGYIYLNQENKSIEFFFYRIYKFCKSCAIKIITIIIQRHVFLFCVMHICWSFYQSCAL